MDAASGGFVAPFLQVSWYHLYIFLAESSLTSTSPNWTGILGSIAWFLLTPREYHLHISSKCWRSLRGHKFGLSYVGVGWVIWRDKAHLPKDLIFELHYLGSVQYSFSLNFSRPAAPIIGQYFNFLRLGHEGYRVAALQDQQNARLLSRALENTGYFMVISDIHRATGKYVGPGIESPNIDVGQKIMQ